MIGQCLEVVWVSNRTFNCFNVGLPCMQHGSNSQSTCQIGCTSTSVKSSICSLLKRMASVFCHPIPLGTTQCGHRLHCGFFLKIPCFPSHITNLICQSSIVLESFFGCHISSFKYCTAQSVNPKFSRRMVHSLHVK